METPIRPYDASRDTDDCVHVFNTTTSIDLSFPQARAIGVHLWCLPYLALSPTTCFVLDSERANQLDPGRDSTAPNAVGYIIGTPDTAAFAAQLKSTYIPGVVSEGPQKHPWLHERDDDPSKPQADNKAVTEAAQNTNETSTNDDNTTMKQENIVSSLRRTLLNAECSPFLHHPDLLARYPAHLHVDILPQYQKRGHGSRLIGRFLRTLTEQNVPGVHLGMGGSNTGARRFYERWGFELCSEVLDDGASGETGRQGDAVYLVKDLRGDEYKGLGVS